MQHYQSSFIQTNYLNVSAPAQNQPSANFDLHYLSQQASAVSNALCHCVQIIFTRHWPAKALVHSAQDNYISQIQFCSTLQFSSFQYPIPVARCQNSTQSWFLPSKLLGWPLPQKLQVHNRHPKWEKMLLDPLLNKVWTKFLVSYVVVSGDPSTHFQCPSTPSSVNPIQTSLSLEYTLLMKIYWRWDIKSKVIKELPWTQSYSYHCDVAE